MRKKKNQKQKQEGKKKNKTKKMQHHFDVRSELGQKVKDAMDEEGYIVLPDILNEEESDRVRGRMWEWVTGVQPAAISRTERNTWYPNARGGVDLWPHSGENYPSDKCCSFGAGWVLGELREILAERIFSTSLAPRSSFLPGRFYISQAYCQWAASKTAVNARYFRIKRFHHLLIWTAHVPAERH